MLKKVKENIKLSPRLQPYLYRANHAFKALRNGSCFSKDGENTSEFLFVVGCGRSGNTLLRRLLVEKFDIYIPPETYVLPRQINQYCVSDFLRWPDKVDSILSMLENHPEFETFGVDSLSDFKVLAKKWRSDQQSFVNLIEGLYRWIGEQNSVTGQWVGDKTPLNTLSLGVIHWAFPKAKFIFIERDPVDVVESYLKAGLYQNAEDAAKRWKNSLKYWERFKKLKSDQDSLEFRYEDLVANPSLALERVSEKFAIPERSEEKQMAPNSLGDVGARQHHSNVQNAPSTVSIGKGRKSMAVENLYTIRKVLGKLPQSRGYKKI
ncbi:sulfotransferase family protein [Chromohalobacter nigrandesensis]|uniref:sulfotransferase family protein n=1 Tax=Chromohalobacter nigrandesensis TaxID=119863 RepID=UPI001FF418C3|nr:sulfotransferase [Chromohalobacter nigrandesensis]MCK0743690.1 sulfotransferase [Chromohalobacter nigrandesensis]